ncbi:MAG: hypothetical protein JOZ69_01365 [Myxococcales bacterium]|nr:hypothetical protein [Myxococcales bacterium]
MGKTTLAVCKLRQCVAQNGSLGMFVDVRRLARAARQHPLGSSSEVPLVAESIRADVLLLDDLGEERGADDAVLDVIRDRHAQDRPTIVTSGHALTMRSGIEVFGQRYGDGIARRLFQGAVVIELRLPPP